MKNTFFPPHIDFANNKLQLKAGFVVKHWFCKPSFRGDLSSINANCLQYTDKRSDQ